MTGPDLDHLALASTRAADNLIRYCHQLGARWLGGADPGTEATEQNEADGGPEFYFGQAEFAGGTKLEFLQPLPGAGSDFLRRFLVRNGPGPHHFTFKVPDIRAAIKRAEQSGYPVVNARFDNPEWQEAFLYPKQSHGIVIQLAQPGQGEGWEPAPPLPPAIQTRQPTIRLVTHLVADLDGAVDLFGRLLAMTTADDGAVENGRYVELTQGPWRLRLVEPTGGDLRHWLGDRPGRIQAVTIAVDRPELVPHLQPTEDGLVVAPEFNQGLRLNIEPLDTDGIRC